MVDARDNATHEFLQFIDACPKTLFCLQRAYCKHNTLSVIESMQQKVQIQKERGAGWARSRPTGTTLFSSFLGRGGEEEKDVCEALTSSRGACPDYLQRMIK